jgi:O-antigen ligase
VKIGNKSKHHHAGLHSTVAPIPPLRATAAIAPPLNFSIRDFFALAFGLFLGLAILKFGNPVILDDKILPPASLSEAWKETWPTRWSILPLAVFTIAGLSLALAEKVRWLPSRMFWVLPLAWFGWQLISATQTVDPSLTRTTLWHFAGCLASYFLGASVLGDKRFLRWLLPGILAAFAFCLVRAVNQRMEFPRDRQLLIEGERTGWTNFPVDVFQEMKRSGTIITTNGTDVANPIFLAKLAKGRVHGTFVYPNALAGAVLLLFPLCIVLAVDRSHCFRPWIRMVIIALTLFLSGAGLFWTGSKSGWLIAMALCAIWLFRLSWPARWKWLTFVAVVVVGLAVFTVRFRNYFATGATSIGARFDYWRAAATITAEHPLTGSGPGTFQRLYSRLKTPEAEMARLVHNDYLEQFSDSGLAGGIAYIAWIASLLMTLGRRVWRDADQIQFAVFLGLLGWFFQGFSEFGLYIPALAWTSFTFLGWLLAVSGKEIDRSCAVE